MKKFNTPVAAIRRIQMLFLIALFALAAGCSSVRFTYNQGDTLLYWWINAYVDLEGEQSAKAKRDIDEFFQWHRKTQLPDYAAVLTKIQRQIAGNPTQADLMADYRELRTRAETMASKAAPQLADLALSLKPEQIAQMEKRFKTKNDDYRRKVLPRDPEKRQKARFKKSMDQFNLWFGSFSGDQEAILRKASDARPITDGEIMLEERMWRQRKVVTLLRNIQQEKPSRETANALVSATLREILNRMDSPERKVFYDAYADSTAKYVLTAIRIATPEQKAHAHKRMQGWIDDFNILAAAAK
jgi:Family of unknown function (DUF6279)